MVILGSDACLYVGNIVHELHHVLSFTHEHQRIDRDKYVELNGQSIKNKPDSFIVDNFEIDPRTQTKSPYDVYSISHYGPTWMQAKQNNVSLVDPVFKYGLSKQDIDSINILYNCTAYIRKNTTEKI